MQNQQASRAGWKNPEHAIMQRRAREDYEGHYQAYTRELGAIRRNAEWHETNDKFAVGKRNQMNEKNMDAELEEANQELKILRNQRLKELYMREWETYENELNAMGLAILKDRDWFSVDWLTNNKHYLSP